MGLAEYYAVLKPPIRGKETCSLINNNLKQVLTLLLWFYKSMNSIEAGGTTPHHCFLTASLSPLNSSRVRLHYRNDYSPHRGLIHEKYCGSKGNMAIRGTDQ
jgi:hypothetical protein